MSEKNKNPYQHTLNLQKTEFSIRANAATKEPELLDRWQKDDLSSKTFQKNKETGKRFLLHDGPPYANGKLHLGHVLNKILKDITLKSKRMQGYWAPITPGWDCHGLPIEIKVESEIEKGEKQDKLEFKKRCREFAQKWVDVQNEEFQNLGCLMNWKVPYKTMDPQYEAAILEAFATFVEHGFIQRKGKTVPWCHSCKTVLAASEIEHKERKDPSIYVLFPFNPSVAQQLFPDVSKDLTINLLIWTTTPWTLPLNRAVVLNNKARYVLLEGKENNAIIVAKELAEKLCATFEIEQKVLVEFDATLLKDKKVHHPFVPHLQVPVLLDNSVLLDEGTACLHSAPGCGPEDYVLGIKNGLEIFSPLSADGQYTQEIEPKDLAGMSIADGQIWVLKKLKELGKLFFKTSMRHAYPHCWRCRNGLMFRATDQWFCDLQTHDLVKKATEKLDTIQFVPEWGKNRLAAFLENRTEWCISRQKQWGVPIPAIICKKCDHAQISADFVRKIAKGVAKEGIEFWDTYEIDKNITCPECNNNDPALFAKETDILDVWFDSGVSFYAVIEKKDKFPLPVDLYLEGSDQHRGWFQSSLLCSMVLKGTPCTNAILTHGFVVDKNGHKMSKSFGNVILPDDMIKKYSRDIIRAWVASADYKNDIAISDDIVKQVSEMYRKIRNTCRFMISNLYDFDLEKDAVSLDKLLEIDQYALANLYDLQNKIIEQYNNYDFPAIFHALNNYCANDLSSLYLDTCKDRLYIEKADGLLRRSAQTAMYHILDSLTRLMSPILSFLAEEVSDFYQKDKKDSIHLQELSNLFDVWELSTKKMSPLVMTGYAKWLQIKTPDEATYQLLMRGIWNVLEEARDVVLKAIESKREAGVVKHSLESKVTLYLDPESDQKKLIDQFVMVLKNNKEDATRFFKDWFIVSQFAFEQKASGLQETDLDWVKVSVDHADGDKCPRCWQWEATDNAEKLCTRCVKVLEK